MWREDRVAGGSGYMTPSGFVKPAEVWTPEVDVLPTPLAKKNPLFNPNGAALPKGIDPVSPLGRAILERQQNMAYEHNEGQGSIFVNDKGDNENRPDRKGTFKLNGIIYEISGWLKQPKTEGGTPWMSLQVREKQTAAAPAPAAPKPDDGNPF